MTNEELGYVAGLLDADGWMSLHDNGYTVTFNCGIVNAAKPVLDWICAEFGGRVRAHSRPTSRIGKNWRQIWSYLPDSASVKSFLIAIRPHLRIKGRQCEILLEFLDTRAKRGPGVYRTSPDVVARRNELLREVRNLNQVGRILELDWSGDRQPKDPNKKRVRRWWKKPSDVADPAEAQESTLGESDSRPVDN